jgi:hypothetical protein
MPSSLAAIDRSGDCLVLQEELTGLLAGGNNSRDAWEIENTEMDPDELPTLL